jgi:ribosomal protein S18 acetylase RimI-like enzyme
MDARNLPSVRKFKREDINKILEIEAEAFPKTAYSREMFLAYARNCVNSFIVIESGEDIAGYMIFDEGGHIHSTAVKPPYRRKGFGKILFLHALSCCKNRLWLEVRSKNIAALQFYQRMGMVMVGRVSGYYGNDDALVMVAKGETEPTVEN